MLYAGPKTSLFAGQPLSKHEHDESGNTAFQPLSPVYFRTFSKRDLLALTFFWSWSIP